MDAITQRAFCNACLRLKRDVVNLNDLGTPTALVIKINDENVIGFSIKDNVWILNNEKWDPTIEDMVILVQGFLESVILIAVQEFEEKSDEIFQSISAKGLENKFSQILNLMSFEENDIEPLPEILIDTLLGNSFEIKFNFKLNNHTVIDNELDSEYKILDEKTIQYIVDNSTYFDLQKAMNDCYLQLNRTK